jgi:hypothetical protein
LKQEITALGELFGVNLAARESLVENPERLGRSSRVRVFAMFTVVTVIHVTGDHYERPYDQSNDDEEKEQSKERRAATHAVTGRPEREWSPDMNTLNKLHRYQP